MFCVNGCETGANPLTKRKTTLNSPTQVSVGYTNISPIIQINLPLWPQLGLPQPPAAWAEWSCSTNIWGPYQMLKRKLRKERGPMSRNPHESILIHSLLSRQSDIRIPREVMMYLTNQGPWWIVSAGWRICDTIKSQYLRQVCTLILQIKKLQRFGEFKYLAENAKSSKWRSCD